MAFMVTPLASAYMSNNHACPTGYNYLRSIIFKHRIDQNLSSVQLLQRITLITGNINPLLSTHYWLFVSGVLSKSSCYYCWYGQDSAQPWHVVIKENARSQSTQWSLIGLNELLYFSGDPLHHISILPHPNGILLDLDYTTHS